MENQNNFCQYCGQKLEKDEIFCSKCGKNLTNNNENKTNTTVNKNKKIPAWGIVLIVICAIFMIGMLFSDNDSSENGSPAEEKNKVLVVDFSTMSTNDITNWCNKNKIICNIEQEYSNTIAKNKFISQSVMPNKKINENEYITIKFSLGKEPSIEYKNALSKAQSYSDTLYMSKKGIYDQLISEYGEGFEKDAAQYAVDNVKANWKYNALKKAKTYRETLHMSKNNIYKQLISKYGEKFTREQAQYAINHLDD